MPKVLVIGSGAREHALAQSIAADPSAQVFVYGDSPGLGRLGEGLGSFSLDAPQKVAEDVRKHGIELAVIGPEAPLAAGFADAIRQAGCLVFGPGRAAARLESSKAFAKDFMQRHRIPTAPGRAFQNVAEAQAYVEGRDVPVVVKADGLAAGKGVVVADDAAEACAAVEAMLAGGRFGDAGRRVVVEDRIEGEELSVHVLFDGEGHAVLAPAQDHKRLEEGDRGPNTGGMGAYSPVPQLTAEVWGRIERDVVNPTLGGLQRDGVDFRGVLFIGLMLKDGAPYVLEYNVRFGDPETEVLLPRLDGSVLPLLHATAAQQLGHAAVRWAHPAALAVVLASAGYPTSKAPPAPITGLEAAAEHAQVFHAGTAWGEATSEGDRPLLATGGRVLVVTGTGASLENARAAAYAGADAIRFEGMQRRRDIGYRALNFAI